MFFCLLATCIPTLFQQGPAPAFAQDGASSRIEAIGARVAGDQRKTRFVLDLSRPAAYTVTVVPDPFRVVIDMRGVIFSLPAGIGKLGRGLVREYRYGRFDGDKARIVIDTSAPVLIDRTFLVEPADGGPARMVIDLIETDVATYAKIKERLDREQANATAHIEPRRGIGADSPGADTTGSEGAGAAPSRSIGKPPLPKPRPQKKSLLAALTPLDLDSDAAVAPDAARPVVKDNARVEPTAVFSPAATGSAEPVPPALPAKPKGKPVVVIDPGHGGVDPGAISRSGTREKDVVLGFARALRDALQATGRYDVKMTRADDTFISLGGRVAIAQKHGADLFISIHADSLKRGVARGSTVYTLSDKASDQEAAEIAASENKADLVGGIPPEAESEGLADILVDLVQRETRNHSMFFANTLVSQLQDATRLNSKPHRYAGFRVLRAPDVPSVLLELGYLSSPEDEKLLTSAAWRKRVARSIVSAVDGFFGTHVSQRR